MTRNKHKQTNTPLKRKVFVGMSGGVDSSVSAALLQREGYDVVGVFIKVWQADFLPCTWREERRDAMRVAAALNIPFLTLDLSQEYKKEVVDYMLHEYECGRVPNPDIMCNKHVKFGAFLNFAQRHGALFVATGHYAQIKKNKFYQLLTSKDQEKDQTYFLWTLTQEQLAHTLFPVGHLTKKSVRSWAKKLGLPNADKKDSQGICFIGAVDIPEFLRHYIKIEKGKVLDEDGRVIGEHDGAILYAIGQRHGFTTEKISSAEQPYFVIAKNMQDNTIVVAHHVREQLSHAHKEIVLSEINLITHNSIEEIKNLYARVRHRGELHPIRIKGNTITFSVPQSDISSGQSIVFYSKDECLGGGIVV